MMELQILEYQSPGKIKFNYDDLKTALVSEMEKRKDTVYTAEEIPAAKKDRADMNRLERALNEERIRLEKNYMANFQEFKDQIDDLRSIIKAGTEGIDRQIKEYESMQKEKKQADIEAYLKEQQEVGAVPKWLDLGDIFMPRWLNATCSFETIKNEIAARMDIIKRETEVIATLPEYSFEAMEVYKTSLDLSRAMTEGQRLADIQKRKEEAEAAEKAKKSAELAEAHEKVQEAKELKDAGEKWIAFEVLVNTEKAVLTRDFFKNNNIQFRRI